LGVTDRTGFLEGRRVVVRNMLYITVKVMEVDEHEV
jgi:hypothetical protein